MYCHIWSLVYSVFAPVCLGHRLAWDVDLFLISIFGTLNIILGVRIMRRRGGGEDKPFRTSTQKTFDGECLGKFKTILIVFVCGNVFGDSVFWSPGRPRASIKCHFTVINRGIANQYIRKVGVEKEFSEVL